MRLYWEQAVYKKPDTAADFPWHQDNGYTYVEPQQYLTCWIALTDADESNGCPWVVPGAHRHGTLRHWMTDLGWRCLDDAPGAVPVPARAGSIVVFSSLTPHRTGPNLTDGVRKAYIVQFAPDGARTVRVEDANAALHDVRRSRAPVPGARRRVGAGIASGSPSRGLVGAARGTACRPSADGCETTPTFAGALRAPRAAPEGGPYSLAPKLIYRIRPCTIW